jgi:hypothetical protein
MEHDSIDMGDDSINMVILDLDMGYLVTLPMTAAVTASIISVDISCDPCARSAAKRRMAASG